MVKIGDVQVDDGAPKGRAGWSFSYRGSELAVAARKVAAFHRERQGVYETQAVDLEARLREGGMELREQQVTGGPRFAAVLDLDIGNQLAEARNRRDSHRALAGTFEAYVGAFGAAGRDCDKSYHLTVGDVDYFCLHREPSE